MIWAAPLLIPGGVCESSFEFSTNTDADVPIHMALGIAHAQIAFSLIMYPRIHIFLIF
jgi:hypothetical protein